ncbi:TetR/AcrR family transcriptional regulator [Cryobacterium melibiosiphilum]|nr:TetR/AcrR family transcriptional regulator [Cryobacterium melibiosiphilum]
MITDPTLGLRDRKRLETRARLEEAAVTLVLRDGLEQTTVDAISDLADVSPRTFFNYFDSKDSAILGLREIEITVAMLAETIDRAAADGLVDAVVHLILEVMGAPLTRSTIKEDRMEIVRRHPHLLAGQLAQFTQIAAQLTEAVQVLLARDPRYAGQGDADRAASADLVLSLCGGAVRAAVKEWAADAAAVRARFDTESTSTRLELRAISLTREVLEKLK